MRLLIEGTHNGAKRIQTIARSFHSRVQFVSFFFVLLNLLRE